VLAALLACVLLPASAYTKQKPKPKPLYWGAVIGKQLTGEAAPFDFGAVEAFERNAGKGISLLGFSQPFADCFSECRSFPFPKLVMERLREHGTIPFLSWASQAVSSSPVQPAYNLSSIINGSHDAYIREFAELAKEWGYPFFLRFDAEMNGFWFPWSEGVNGNKRGEFVAAWRHVHNIFTEVGTANATWVWCPNVDFTRNLAPLEGLRSGTAEKLADTLRAWILHQGRREDIAAALFVHPQTVRYRMGQIRDLYGDKLDDPETILELTLALA
jgi:hypothetical protein